MTETHSPAKSETRTLLLQAGYDCLVTGGWASTNMRKIAGTVGIQAPSIYNHFATKSDFGLALIEFLHERTLHEADEIEKTQPLLIDRLTKFAAVPVVPGHLLVSCPIYIAQAEFAVFPSEMQGAVQAMISDILSLIERWIERAKASGEITRINDPSNQSLIVFSIMEHGIQLRRIRDNALDVHQLILEWYQSVE